MELRQRKRLNNLPKFNIGQDGNRSFYSPTLTNQMDIQRMLQQNYTHNFSGFYNPNAGNTPTKDQLAGLQKKIDDSGINDPNIKDYTGFINKTNAVAGGVGSIAQNVIGNLSVKSQDELLADAGRYNGSVMGVGYTAQNDINKDAELSGYDKKAGLNTLSSTVSGVQAGAAFGPVGAVIGGAAGLLAGIGSWFGGKHALRKRINNARNFATRTNIANRAGAMSIGLQNQYYGDNQYTQDDILYG